VAESLSDKSPTPQKWLYCHGQQFRKLAHAGLQWLEKNQQIVNELNVFPVPDGDTGTNMVLTMRSAFGRIRDSQETHAGRVAGELAHGALMGARGNSGVILSQIWRGLARGLKEHDSFDAEELAKALQEAADTAYGGVMRPVEGTILTVIREGAEEAVDAARKSKDLRFVLERVLERCQQSLRRTPELLPILKQAGVVDAGGQGLVYILEGMLLYVHGQMAELERHKAEAEAVIPAQALAMPEGGDLENPYDVQFILMGQGLDVLTVRDTIDAMGDSTVVVGDKTTIKVHIHVKDPGQPLSYGSSLGKVTDVVVENMQMQMEAIVNNTTAPIADDPPDLAIEPGQIGIVAVASGDGLARVFRSLGAAYIVNGGQTNNPSTEEMLRAVQEIPTDNVIILPNNKNIVLCSEAARDLSPKQVAVVPTQTIPQGISAMLCHNPDGDLSDIASAMEATIPMISTGEITRATRSVELDGVQVNEGELIGLADGRLCVSGTNMAEIIRDVLVGMRMEEREIVTIYYGEDATLADATGAKTQIEQLYPDAEVELLAGGQAYYYYILGAE
jgi:DAK2 domain fusion protein YloV